MSISIEIVIFKQNKEIKQEGEREMAKSQIQALADDASEFFLRMEIVNQDPDDAVIELLKLPSEEAKKILRSNLPSGCRGKIYTSLNLLSQKIQVLFESLESV